MYQWNEPIAPAARTARFAATVMFSIGPEKYGFSLSDKKTHGVGRGHLFGADLHTNNSPARRLEARG
jgi:hypothetical protein